MKNDQAERLAIIDGVRTPFAKMGTVLAGMSAGDLGHAAVSGLLAKTGIDVSMIDEVLMGCVSQPADSMNIARVIALRSGIPEQVPAMTVHRNCASGFESLTVAYERLRAGNGETFIVGGAESMSQAPLIYQMSAAIKFAALAKSKSALARIKALAAFRPADLKPLIGIRLGLTDPVSGLNMGQTAELLACENGISRAEQDVFSLQSHLRASAARERLAGEIWPVYPPSRGGKPQAVLEDNGIRAEQTIEALAKLRPVFDRKTGSVTPGNASQITDGAVALLVMSESKAAGLGYEPLGFLSGYSYTGCDPSRMGLGPVSAIQAVNRRLGLRIEDADLIEINEAFAVQVLAVLKHLEMDGMRVPASKLNVNGGSIALGHPVGATGARLILTALKELQRRNEERALVSLCVGGGQGGALWLTRK